MVPKLVKFAWNMTFWALIIILTSKKLETNQFFGSTIIWSILGEYEPFNVLRWWIFNVDTGEAEN